MTEIELKLELDAAQEQHLRATPVLKALTAGRATTQTLHAVYYDTVDHALRRDGIALRLRKEGRRWVQTVKQARGPMQRGLSMPLEDECPAPGGRLTPERICDDDLRERVLGAVQMGLQPSVETIFKRTKRVLTGPSGGRIEFALDVGELVGGDRRQSLIEAELELLEGTPADLYDVAAILLGTGPVRFSEVSKSARAAALLNGAADAPRAERRARTVIISPDETAEAAATRILDEALAHFLPNVALSIETEHPEGPHQVRVALRRLRAALSAFSPVLGATTVERWAAQAREIGAQVGALRDLDVLADDLVAPVGHAHPDTGFDALLTAIADRRSSVRAEVRAELVGSGTTHFALGFAAFLAGRGWLDPADHDQTARLAQPVGAFAAKVLTKRWKKAAAYGQRIDDLTIDERHEMRKELKKLRYMVEAFESLYPPDRVKHFLKQLKALQESFGALNDVAMAEEILSADTAPGTGDAAASRAAGRVLGHLGAEADRLWPEAAAGWAALAKTRKFWR